MQNYHAYAINELRKMKKSQNYILMVKHNIKLFVYTKTILNECLRKFDDLQTISLVLPSVRGSLT